MVVGTQRHVRIFLAFVHHVDAEGCLRDPADSPPAAGVALQEVTQSSARAGTTAARSCLKHTERVARAHPNAPPTARYKWYVVLSRKRTQWNSALCRYEKHIVISTRTSGVALAARPRRVAQGRAGSRACIRACVAHMCARGASGRSAASAAGPALLLALLLLRARLRARCPQALKLILQSANRRLRAPRGGLGDCAGAPAAAARVHHVMNHLGPRP